MVVHVIDSVSGNDIFTVSGNDTNTEIDYSPITERLDSIENTLDGILFFVVFTWCAARFYHIVNHHFTRKGGK